MPDTTILLLSGGGHTGANVLAAIGTRRSTTRLIATTDVTDEPTLFAFDQVYLAPNLRADAASFERRLLDVMALEKPDLVVPCRDDDVRFLSALKSRRPDLGRAFLCGAPAVAEVVSDKWLSFEFAKRYGLPFAQSFRCEPGQNIDDMAAFIDSAGLPLVCKPRDGSDSRGITLITSAAQARQAIQRPDHVLQEYLGNAAAVRAYVEAVRSTGVPLFHSFEGNKRSIQIMIGPDSTTAYVFCTRNEPTGRNARRVSIDSDSAARAIGVRCAAAFADAGWYGPMNIQCQPDVNGELKIHEFNARFTGATAARKHLGMDELAITLKRFCGVTIEACEAGSGVGTCTTAREGLAARAVATVTRETLMVNGVWSKRATL